MEYIPDYINGKHGRKKPQYLHPKLKPILETTYGVAVYQEQLLRIARDLAGFTYGQADVLRKAVGKKIKELLDEQEHKMVDGMVENGIDKKVAKQIWEFILPFAAYGFNRSHAACYAMIGYQTAWLKANYPAEFMAALLTADQQNLDRIAIEVDECRQMGIEVLAPDINESFADFGVVADSLSAGKPRIRFGLLAVKGLGENIVAEMIKERKENGAFKDLEDLLMRVRSKDLNKRSLEAMGKVGVLDTLSERNAILRHMDKLLSFISEFNKGAASAQESLFGASSVAGRARLKLEKVEPLDKKQRLTWEKELLGLYISEHPMTDISGVVRNYAVSCAILRTCADGAQVRVAGVISSIKKILTKKGDAMLFVKIEDTTGEVEVLVFPKALAANPHMWLADTIVIVSGTVSDKDNERKVLCDCATVLNAVNLKETLDSFLISSRENSPRKRSNFSGGFGAMTKPGEVKAAEPLPGKAINLKLFQPLDYDLSRQLKDLILKHQGNQLLELIVTRGEAKEKIRTTFKVNYNDDFRRTAEELLGEGVLEVLD